jgi:hypothetical protein
MFAHKFSEKNIFFMFHVKETNFDAPASSMTTPRNRILSRFINKATTSMTTKGTFFLSVVAL